MVYIASHLTRITHRSNYVPILFLPLLAGMRFWPAFVCLSVWLCEQESYEWNFTKLDQRVDYRPAEMLRPRSHTGIEDKILAPAWLHWPLSRPRPSRATRPQDKNVGLGIGVQHLAWFTINAMTREDIIRFWIDWLIDWLIEQGLTSH